MKIYLKKTNDACVIPFKTYDSDFCYDCVAVSEEEIAPNVWKYGLGFAIQMVNRVSHIILSVSLRPRSSVYKTGMVLSNSVGTVDENFRGEISAIFYHVLPNMPRYKVGDKICQMYIDTTLPVDFEVVEALSQSDRGSNGYGSTGR